MTQPTPLTERLRALVDTVQHNERALQRFQQIEVSLVSARDFASFHDTLVSALPQTFDLSQVTLWLDESAAPARDLLDPETSRGIDQRFLRSGQPIALPLKAGGRPWLGRPGDLGAAACAAFFGDDGDGNSAGIPASVAVLPLGGEQVVSGYLCLGSTDPARFSDGMATDLLERFACFVSAGLDNVAQRERLKHLGMTDTLTGLPNRRYFDARLREEIQRAGRYTSAIACLFIDIDYFKKINDTLGHVVGDRALAAVAACIRKALRLGDTVARYGGEEFVALVQGDVSDGRIVAERVRRAVETLEVRDDAGLPITLTASIGVAARVISTSLLSQGDPARTLLEEADRAMYRAKRGGRNRVEIHTDESAVHRNGETR